MTFSLILENAGWVFGLMTVLWLVSVRLGDVSIVDPWWSMVFLLVTVRTAWVTGMSPVKWLLVSLVTVWAVRLWLHLLWRSRGKPEDPRYAAFRRRFGPARYWWVSLFQVFWLQAVLALLISAPLQVAASGPLRPLSLSLVAGALLAAVGLGIEAVADAQLASFRRDPSRRGQVLDSGLWRYSRHPNYFGEALVAWGFWLCSLDTPLGIATVFAPALMTFLLLKVSGVTMLDEHLSSSRPGYREYMRRTSAFFPRPPRNAVP